MAKFTYRMQNILDIKIKLENQAKLHMRRRADSCGRAGEASRDPDAQGRLREKIKELVNGTLDIQEIQECKRAIDVMKSLQRAQMMKVHAAEKTLEMARIELNRGWWSERRMKLRERAFEEFKQEIAWAESKGK